MRVNISVWLSIFILLNLTIGSFGQNVIESQGVKLLNKENVSLNISIKHNKVKVGEEFDLTVLIENKFLRNISTTAFHIDDILAFFEVEIIDSEGHLATRKDESNKPRFGSKTGLELASGEKFYSKLQLSKAYKLLPGKYLMRVDFVAIDSIKREKITVNSNSLEFTVIE